MANILNFLVKSNFNIKEALNYKKAYNRIVNSELFDEEFYKDNFYSSDEDLLMHYLFEGYKEDFDPSLNFNTLRYYYAYPNVKKSNLNPLVHYVLWGKNENKTIFPSSILEKQNIIEENKKYLHNYEFDEEPLVSIIILNRNGRENLEILFKDFAEKTNYSNFEVILVDNASDDDSVEYVKSLDVDYPLIIMENEENLSFSKANNDAAKASNGEYVLLLNNDIEPTYGWLNEMMGIMLKNENVGSVGAKLLYPYFKEDKAHKRSFKIQHGGDIFAFGDNLIRPHNQYKFFNPFDEHVSHTRKAISVTGAVLLVKKSLYLDIGGLDEDYFYCFEDVDFSLKLHKSNYDIYYCSSALLFHYESYTRKDNSENVARNRKVLFSKWYNYLNRHIFMDMIESKEFFCDAKLKIMLVSKKFENKKTDNEFILNLKEELENRNYSVKLSNKIKSLKNFDVIISFSENLDLEKSNIRENAIKVLWLNENNGDMNLNSNFYDFIITNEKNIYNSVNDQEIYYIDSDYTKEFLKALEEYITKKFN